MKQCIFVLILALMSHSQDLPSLWSASVPETPQPSKLSSADRELLTVLQLPLNSLDFMENITDEGIKSQADEMRTFMRKLAPAVSASKSAKPKTYEDNLKTAKKRLISLRKKQLKKYDDWRTASWKNINKYLEGSQRVFDTNDQLNIKENEKYYQLFLVEDGEKRHYLIPFVNLENRLLEIIENELSIIADNKALKRVANRATSRASDRLARRVRRQSQRNRRAYLHSVRQMHREYMENWKLNEKFAGEDDR